MIKEVVIMANYNGFIYETTCTINGMKYRGRHGRIGDPSDPDDSWYLGSPLNEQFWIDLETYGEENFTREILDPGPYTLEEAIEREGYRLREVDAANNPQYYNLSNWSGVHDQTGKKNPMYGKTWKQSEETCRKKSEALRGKPKSPEHVLHMRESRRGKCTGDDNIMRRPEHRERQSEIYGSLPDDHPMKNHSGENSPLYGCHYTWMTNGTDNRRAKDDIMKTELESQGYYEGYTHTPNTSEKAAESRRKGRAKALYIRICKLCGREFEARSGNARYCGCDRKKDIV